MKQVQLYAQRPEEEVEALAGELLDETAYDMLVGGEDTMVYRPDGTILFVLLKGAMLPHVAQETMDSFRSASVSDNITNRGIAAGKGLHKLSTRRDGSLSKTKRVHYEEQQHLVNATNGVGGFFDPGERFPFCRLSSWSAEHTQEWGYVQQYMAGAHRLFAQHMPDRHAAQEAVAARTRPEWLIPDTCFTSVTVNRNWQTAVHRDMGDLKAGFGVMGLLGNNQYNGCYFTYPKYRVACNLRHGDLIIDDVHEWHGNTPLVPYEGQEHERISIVMYYREYMADCGTPEYEEERRRVFVVEDPGVRAFAKRQVIDTRIKRDDLKVYLAVIANTYDIQAADLAGPANWYVPQGQEHRYTSQNLTSVIPAESQVAACNLALEDAFARGLPCLLFASDVVKLGKHVRRHRIEPCTIREVVDTLHSLLVNTRTRMAGLATNSMPISDPALPDVYLSGFIPATCWLVLPNSLRYDPQMLAYWQEDYYLKHMKEYGGVLRLENYTAQQMPGAANIIWHAFDRQVYLHALQTRWGPAAQAGPRGVLFLRPRLIVPKEQAKLL